MQNYKNNQIFLFGQTMNLLIDFKVLFIDGFY